jgi:hypothetical protein
MAKGKSKRKAFEDAVASEDIEIITRVAIGVAKDEGHPRWFQAFSYLIDQTAGKATQTVEITGVQPMSIVYTPEIAKMMGARSVQARVADETGEVHDINIGIEDE